MNRIFDFSTSHASEITKALEESIRELRYINPSFLSPELLDRIYTICVYNLRPESQNEKLACAVVEEKLNFLPER